MSSEWAPLTWGDIASLEYGKALRDYQHSDGPFPVYGTNGPIGSHHVPLCDSAGVVIGRKGAYRGVHFSPRPFYVIDTAFYLKPRPEFAVDAKWSYYCLLTYDINSMDSGSAIPSTSRDEFYKLSVRLPPIEEQQAIATLLGSLDDRIAILRDTNATLEAIAQALFKSWFVDFDPVRAKSQGLAPAGMDEATAALFPDSFEESGRGPIPIGWTEASIYNIAQVVYGAPFASSKFNTEARGRPLIRIRDLRDEAPGVHTPEVHPKGYVVKPGDIVVGMDGEFRAYLWGGEEAWLNQRVCVFAPRTGVSAAFLRATIEPQLAHIEATETATTVIHLGKGDIDRFVTLVPSVVVMDAFSGVVDPLYSRIVSNKQTARSLAALRDTLLPRLISGQLRLPEAEKTFEEALA